MQAALRKLWQWLGPRGTAAVAALLIFIAILFQNLDTITVNILFWDAVALAKPYFILLCMVLGFVIGMWAGWRLRARRGSN